MNLWLRKEIKNLNCVTISVEVAQKSLFSTVSLGVNSSLIRNFRLVVDNLKHIEADKQTRKIEPDMVNTTIVDH